MKTMAGSSVAFAFLWLAAFGLVTVRAQLGTLTEIPLADNVTASLPGGGGPEAVVSDGTCIWVAEQFTNSVTRLDPLTGLRLGTFAVGNRPVALLVVGSTLWVANLQSDTLTKLRTSDGALLGTFPVSGGPGGLAFDVSISG